MLSLNVTVDKHDFSKLTAWNKIVILSWNVVIPAQFYKICFRQICKRSSKLKNKNLFLSERTNVLSSGPPIKLPEH